MQRTNPCISCGACCAHFRVSFHWTEATDYIAGSVPIELTEDLNDHLRAMKGTNQKNPRCVALEGTVGQVVHCAIYPKRSTTCQEFIPSWQDGLPHEECDKARLAWGLEPLTPEYWQDPGDLPQAA